VDWLEQGQFEVVYHLYALRRGERMLAAGQPDGPLGPVVLKVRVPRDNPVVPSVTSLWLSALFQEREAYDMLGIRFEGHPDLKRIYLWDEYTDHPLRKDYVPEEA
jgi:NADH:ubiquinone oxidoreductase subunit C